MKNLIIALFLISAPAFALKSRQVTFSAANPLPINYSTGGQSRVISELGTSNKNLLFLTTAADVVCHLNAPNSEQVPSSPQEIYLVASEPILVKDIGGLQNIFCKSSTAAKTAGWLSVLAY